MRRFTLCFAAVSLAALVPLGACTDPEPAADVRTEVGPDTVDETSSETSDDVETTGPTVPLFRFGTAVGQPMSAAPFPNDLYLLPGGGIDVELDEDPGLATAAKVEKLTLWEAQARQRDGFAFSAPIRFFIDGEPDMASLDGRVQLVDSADGSELPLQLFWDPHTSAIVVLPQWGHSMAPGRTYIAMVQSGVTTVDGEAYMAADGFAEALTEGSSAVQTAFAPLRAWLGDGASPTLLAATVFTTESADALGQAIVAAVNAYPLAPPSTMVGRNGAGGPDIVSPLIEGAALDALFGTTASPWETMPAAWGDTARADAAMFAGGQEYEGGARHDFIGRVINGSLLMPAFHYVEDGIGGVRNSAFQTLPDGTIVTTLDVMVPFTIYLCDTHLADPSNLPIAMFQHGGTGERLGAIAIANMNCQNNKVATFAMDGPFHGGRIEVELDSDNGVVVPVRADGVNIYTGRKVADLDFTPDYQGDGGGAVETVGPLFALPLELDPAVVETNLLSIAAETLVALRYLKEGAWSSIVPGLSFDPSNIFHTSLSFGSSFTTAALAMGADFKGVISSVPSGYIYTSNLLMAPSNAGLAATIHKPVVGSAWAVNDIIAAGFRDFGAGMIQWLSERADPLAWARGVGDIPVLSSGDSWDETLYTPAQITFNNAFGFNVYTAGTPWTLDSGVPGAANVVASEWSAPTDDDRALFYNVDSCHSQIATPICANTYEKTPAPVAKRAERLVFPSPICALHTQADHFVGALLAGNTSELTIAPTGDCESFYGSN